MKKTLVKSNRKVFSGILSFIFTLSLFTLFLPLKATAATYPYDYNDNGFVYMVYSDHVVAVGFEPNTGIVKKCAVEENPKSEIDRYQAA